MASVFVTKWDGSHPPSAEEVRERMRRDNLSGYAWSNGPNDEYAPHSHSFDKVIYVLSGSLTWILPATGQEITTHAGDRLDLPRGTIHAARVGMNGVECFEAHE